MRIRKLEIAGFKSFVDRTVIHFDEDVIGIVGPNGCGKSNIVDSIRWCMGEQSAKHLRGRAMSDVIFNGSESRGPHGLAEVTLTFDNSDPAAAQTLPIEYREYAEIAVTRRLYRDGTSEYLINKTIVRLKDITDLFLGTGVGTKAYSIIEQGKIGLIVSARAEDRRMLIEEAAGITKYKARKKQAELKMEQTRQNLLRIGDIVSEIQRSLSSLKRQAAKAERYIAYRKELEDLMLHEASHKLLEIISLRKRDAFARAEYAEKVLASRTALAARDAELEVQRLAVHQQEERAEKVQNEAFAADNDVRTHQAELLRAKDKHRHLEERRAAATLEQQDLEKTIADLVVERKQLEEQLATVQADEQRESTEALDEHERLEELRFGEKEADAEASRLRKQAADASAKVAAAEATLAGYERRLSDMLVRRDKLEDELGKLIYDAENLETKRAELAEEAASAAERKQSTTTLRAQLEAEAKTLREAAVSNDKRVDTAKNELNQKRNRLRALEEVHARLEGVGAGTKALLKTKDPSFAGLVADRIEAPSEMLAAFAALLGERLQAIVVTNTEHAATLLADLAAKKQGRAMLVAARPAYVAGVSRQPLVDEDVVGPLFEKLRFAPEDEPLVRALVGDALVVRSAAAAVRLAPKSSGVTLVSLDGTVVRPDGTVSGGAGDAVAAGLLEQKREIRELHEVVAKLADQVTALLDTQQAERTRLAEITAAVDKARSDAHASEIAAVTAEKDLRRIDEQVIAAQKRRSVVDRDLAEIIGNLENTGGEQGEAQDKLDDGKRVQTEITGQLQSAEYLATEWRERVLAQQSVVTERKVRLARVRERVTSVGSTVDRLARSVDELSGRIKRLDNERTECAKGAGEAAALMMLSREGLDGAVKRAQKAHASLEEARRKLDEARQVLAGKDAELKDLRQALADATDKLRHHEMALARLDIEEKHLLDGVREKFRGLELHTIVGDYHKRAPIEAQHKTRMQELGELLDRMGPVNLEAMREYKEAEERYAYYAKQKEDLDNALADLEKAIAQMNRESKRLFKTTFDGINMRFKALFPRMFRGGAAELRLTNPEDMLETGIEILAQPPGKKLGNIELMSGGEKALTAVSLIFAIFQFKPSPFCVLDEVDAPLDEANVARYNEAIRAMTSQSQFILITHIKRTMQSVDVLYGVTMQEPGVSKLVSVRVNENAKAKEKAPAAAVA